MLTGGVFFTLHCVVLRGTIGHGHSNRSRSLCLSRSGRRASAHETIRYPQRSSKTKDY